MWDNILDVIKALEPLILVIIPCVFGIWLKLKLKLQDKKIEVLKKVSDENKQKFLDWQHDESIKLYSKLKEVCNMYCDLCHVETSFIQLENGTLATSKLCNMFFSCIAEDDRYTNNKKLTDTLQRIPFIRLSNWFNKVNTSKHTVVYLNEEKDIDSLFLDCIGIKTLVSGAVKKRGNIIGICNFAFYKKQEDFYVLGTNFHDNMLKFVSAVEAIFLSYDTERENKKKELNITNE